jgi:hypothetical protein
LRAKLLRRRYLVLGAKPSTMFQFINHPATYQLAFFFPFRKQHDAEQ